MVRGLRSLCILAVCLAAGAHMAEAASAHGRKILQTTAPPGGACGAAANARCPNGQCCSQWGWCGVSSGHCGTGCQALYSASNSACAGSGTTAPAPPPVTTNPVAPPPPPATGCVDTYAACPAWGPSSCIFGGVPQLCPCMCGGGGTTAPAPPAAQPPAPAPQPSGATQTSTGVSYHLYESVNFPAIPEAGAAAQYLPGSNPGYTINGLYCTDFMRNNPGIPWSTVGWTATTGIATGALRCGDRICIRNRRNNAQTTAYVVDQGGKGSPTGFDLDYARVFKALDADNQNYLRGSMDIDWWKC